MKGKILKKKHLIISRKGSLTVQFLLGFILILSFVMLFAAMTLTLAVSAVTQYITYAAARSLYLGHESKTYQYETAMEKYEMLMGKSAFERLFQPGLFKVKKASDLQKENGLGINGEFSVTGSEPNLFFGVWTEFVPKVLEMETLWGDTEEEEAFFETAIGSYLGREPASDECKAFIKKRWKFISNKLGPLSVSWANDPASSYKEEDDDNGC